VPGKRLAMRKTREVLRLHFDLKLATTVQIVACKQQAVCEAVMISDAIVAGQISKLMLDITRKLDESVAAVQETCSLEEFTVYRTAVGRILGDVLLEVLNPLYSRHPTLRPPGFE
jgi:hypothetical protein